MKTYVLTKKSLKEYQLIEHVVLATDRTHLKEILKKHNLTYQDFEVKEHKKSGIILTSVD